MMFLAVLAGLIFPAGVRADSIGMVTGTKTGTYIQFGQDIARLARTVGVEIEVKESEGSMDNIRRMMSAENAGLGIVQSDVLEYLTRSPDPQMRRISERLRVVFPLYNEEVHLFARTNIQSIEDLMGQRVVVGTRGSGSWLTSNHLLRLLNVQAAEAIELPPPEGASAVLRGEADAMFYVAGKPVKLFSTLVTLQQDPRYAALVNDVHFVPLHHAAMSREYVPSSLGPNDYAWVSQTIPTVAVKAVLMTYNFSDRQQLYHRIRCDQLATLANAIRGNLAELQGMGHPKWQEVDLAQEISIWQLDGCSHAARRAPPPQKVQQDDDLLKAVSDIIRGREPSR